MKTLLNAFNVGEVSPLIWRVDLENMRRACRRLRNFVPSVFGAAMRRPSLLHVAMAHDPAKGVRLMPFNFSATTKYVVEVGHLYMRFWDGATATVNGSPIASPYTEGEIDALQFVQINDVMFLAHQNHPPYELLRQPGNVWELRAIPWKFPPLRDENLDATTLTLSAATGTNVTLSASAATFVAGHVESFWQIGHFRDALSSELTFAPGGGTNQSGDSTPIRVKGRWDFKTLGRWKGSIFLEEQNAAGGWDILRRWTGEMDTNITTSGTNDEERVMRLRASGITAEPAGGTVENPEIDQPRFVLEAYDSRVYGLVKITAVTDATTATVDVVKAAWSTAATTLWSEGAWSTYRGFPRTVAMHEQRLIFGGTVTEPQKLWASVTGDFRNFEQTALDDGAWVYQIAAQEANPIVWIASQSGLIIGTQGDEWLMDGGENTGITPLNAVAKRQSSYGSEPFQAFLCGGVVIFVQRGGSRLMEYVFQFEEQNYVAPEISQLAEHLVRGGIRAAAYAQNPDRVLWVVTREGMLLSCLYRREEQVVAWSAHPTEGTVESVAVVYGNLTAADEVWVSVIRNGTRRVERLDPRHWVKLHDEQASGELHEVFHLDAAVTKAGDEPFTEVEGLGHLAGLDVRVMADDAELSSADFTIDAGVLTLGSPATFVAVGLPFTSVLQPMPIEIPMQDGTAQGRKIHTPFFDVRFYRSGACSYSDAPGVSQYQVDFRRPQHLMDHAPPLYTGNRRLQAQARFLDEFSMVLETQSPLPLNILSLIPTSEVYGK